MIDKNGIISGCRDRYPSYLLCLKRPVYVLIVTTNSKRFYGMNHINVDHLSECPRQNFPTGEGYELCENVCRQFAHAEVNAVADALAVGADLREAKVYLTGHDYCCESCLNHMWGYGIASAYCLDSGKLYTL